MDKSKKIIKKNNLCETCINRDNNANGFYCMILNPKYKYSDNKIKCNGFKIDQHSLSRSGDIPQG